MAKPTHRVRRLIVLAVLALVLVAGTLFYLRYFATFRFWIPPPVGSGPAGPSVPASAFEQLWTDREVALVGLGDSVTAGYGASPGHSYFERLVRNDEDEFPDMNGICLSAVLPALTSHNFSVSGSDSIQHASDQVAKLQTFPADVFGIVVMTTGGNDLIHWYGRGTPKEGAMYGATLKEARPWIENFAARLDSMLTGIARAFPGGAHIFLANIYDPSDTVGDPTAAWLPPWDDMLSVHAEYNRVIEAAAERHENVTLVDIRTPFLGHGVHCVQWWREMYRPEDPHYWYYSNLEDPNDRGYDALRRIFLNKMADVLPAVLEGARGR